MSPRSGSSQEVSDVQLAALEAYAVPTAKWRTDPLLSMWKNFRLSITLRYEVPLTFAEGEHSTDLV